MSDHLRSPPGPTMVDPGPPVCRWCRKTEAEHRPASDPNRPKARCPCLMWRELFVPTTPTVPPKSDSGPLCAERHGSTCMCRGCRELWTPGLLPPPEHTIPDAHRLIVAAELWKLHTESGRIHMDQTLTEYERLVKARTR